MLYQRPEGVEFLDERNSRKLDELGIFPPSIERTDRELKKIGDISRLRQFYSVINGESRFRDLPLQVYNPALLSTSMRALQVHSMGFDQEGNNVIAQKENNLYILEQNETNGIFLPNQGGYSTGQNIELSGARTICSIHSHPHGILESDYYSLLGKKVDPKEVEFNHNLPSESDLTSLLERKPTKQGGNLETNSIIVVGPQIATCITRTDETPPFREHTRSSYYDLLDEFKSLPSGNLGYDFNSRVKQFLAILKKYRLAMYIMPLGKNDPMMLWDRFYPKPENVQ